METKRKKRLWEAWEEQALILLYPNHPTERIATSLGRPVSGVYGKAAAMGLQKSEEFLKSPECGRLVKGSKKGAKSTFKPGHKPWNAGMKGLKVAGSEKGHFKKGHQPKNTKHDFAISEHADTSGRIYKHIRISKNKWVLYHRYLWEETYGPIPKGSILQFKDGNSLNVCLENLELIDRQEQIKQNSGALNLPDTYVAAVLSVRQPELRKELLQQPELLQVARMNYQLQRVIKNESNG